MSDSPEAPVAEMQAEPENRVWRIREATNARAAMVFDAHRSSQSWQPQPPRRVEALVRAVLFIMAKDESDIIGQNLVHHYALGFRRFFILDNASIDDTAAVIAAFRAAHADAEVFAAYDFVVGHYQAAKMKALEAYMQAYLSYEDIQPEWLFFVDADEFITCGLSEHDDSLRYFGAVLDDPTKILLVFNWVQCASRDVIQELSTRQDLFEAFPLTWPRMRVQVPKIAYRLGKGLEPIQGNHSITSYTYEDSSIVVMADLGFYIFHFPTRTVAQLRKKLINGNTALTATKDRDGLSETASHWRTYYKWYLMQGDVAIENIIRDHIASCVQDGTSPE